MTIEQKTRVFISLLPALVAALLVMLMPNLERIFAPVVRDFLITSMTSSGNSLVMTGYMRKVRDCRFVGVQAIAIDSAGHARDAPLIFLDAANNTATRPQGAQAWGPWKVTVQATEAETLRLVATHRCHLVYANDTTLANIPLHTP